MSRGMDNEWTSIEALPKINHREVRQHREDCDTLETKRFGMFLGSEYVFRVTAFLFPQSSFNSMTKALGLGARRGKARVLSLERRDGKRTEGLRKMECCASVSVCVFACVHMCVTHRRSYLAGDVQCAESRSWLKCRCIPTRRLDSANNGETFTGNYTTFPEASLVLPFHPAAPLPLPSSHPTNLLPTPSRPHPQEHDLVLIEFYAWPSVGSISIKN